MRKHGLWAAAGLVLGLSAWAVGQSPDEDLVDRLQRLREAADKALATEASEPTAPPRVGPHVLRFQEVGDLTSPLTQHLAPNLRRGAKDRYAMSESGNQGVGTLEELQELIRISVQPRSWEEGGAIWGTRGMLFTMSTPGLADAVGDYLDKKVRVSIQRFVTVDARVFTLSADDARELSSTVGGLFTDADRRAFAENGKWGGRTTATVRTSGRMGQQILVYTGRRMAQMAGQKPKLGDKVSITEPVVEALHDGVALQLIVDGSAARGFAVSVTYQRAALTSSNKIDLRNGPITQSYMDRETARMRGSWPDGKWAVVSREDVSGLHRLVVLRVSHAGGAR